jgi:hypothetical protein
MAHNRGVYDPGWMLATCYIGQMTKGPFIIWAQVGVSDGPPTRYALNDLDDLQGCRLVIR